MLSDDAAAMAVVLKAMLGAQGVEGVVGARGRVRRWPRMQARPRWPARAEEAEEAAKAEAGQPRSPSLTLCIMPSRDLRSWKTLRGASWCKSGR